MDTKTESAVREIDDILISVGGACELISALVHMHESYTDDRARLKLPDDMSSEFASMQYRLISEIETEMNHLEKVMDALRKEE